MYIFTVVNNNLITFLTNNYLIQFITGYSVSTIQLVTEPGIFYFFFFYLKATLHINIILHNRRKQECLNYSSFASCFYCNSFVSNVSYIAWSYWSLIISFSRLIFLAVFGPSNGSPLVFHPTSFVESDTKLCQVQ